MDQQSLNTDNSQLLSQLAGETDQAVQHLNTRVKDDTSFEARFDELEQQMDEAAKIRDKRERDLRMKVLSADLEELRKDAEREERDLAQAVFGLNTMLEGMGAEYANLNQPSEAELTMISRAEKQIDDAKSELAAAKRRRFFRGRAIAEAEEEVEKAQKALEEVRIEAKRKGRQRLMSANMDASLQDFMLRVEKTLQIMERRKAEIETQLRNISTRKVLAFSVKEQSARALETLDEKLNDAEAQLQAKEGELDTLVNGTPEHAQVTEDVSRLRTEVEDLRGRRNTAFVLFQSKEKFAAELEVHERTQMKLRDNQRMWITALRSDTEERVVTFRSRLEAMKAMADQDIAKQIDDMGADMDQKNVEYMARAGAVSDNIRMTRMEKHPQRVADIANARAAQAEAIQRIRERELKLIEHFKEQYGIDPTKSSFFTYVDADYADADGAEDATF